MDAAKNVTATFALKTYLLSVTRAGTGSGTVTSDVNGLDCGVTCGVSPDHGTVVTLSASPAVGSNFTGWSGACAGTGDCVVTMDAAKNVTATFTALPAPTVIAGGLAHSCARLADGTARCWGRNSNGQLGNGGTTPSSRPVKVAGLSNVSAVAAGNAFSCAVVTAGISGRVRCWGSNSNGQLGDGTVVQRVVPVSVTLSNGTSLSGVSRISTGSAFACAVVGPGPSGKAYCWGSNSRGQLGDGSLTQRLRAVPVKATASLSLTGVVAVSAGSLSACAVLSSGAVRCWGSNDLGQLGNGSNLTSRYPVTVAGIDGVSSKATEIAVGSGFACARLTNGSVRCWGANNFGQLGNGGSAGSSRPVVVRASATANLTGVTALAVGASHACVIVGTGTNARVRCWGSNSSGQLGDGTATGRRYATLCSGFQGGVRAISAGANHTLALVPTTVRPPSSAATWGLNSSGQLGIGALGSRMVPTVVVAL